MGTGRPALVLLFGSPSAERRVSVASAQFVAGQLAALDGARAQPVRLWFWTPDGQVHEVSRAQLEAHRDPFTSEFDVASDAGWASLDAALDSLDKERDLVFLAVHGGEGEDGSLQRLLEKRGLAFTGSGSAASALAFNKTRCLALASAQGIRTARGRVLEARASGAARAQVEAAFAELGPIVLKPESSGSSVHLAFVRSAEEIDAAARVLGAVPALRFRAEQIVNGREFTVGVIEQAGGLRALPCSEVVMGKGRNFDYEGKYLGAGSLEITPAEIDASLSDALSAAAMTVHRALGCRGYSRSDFIVDAQGPVFLEINTLPGLTRSSFIPQQLEAAAIPFQRFLAEQIALASALRDR